MSLKSKKPKYRRRGDRLIVTYPNGQCYLYAPHGQRRRIVELSRPGEQCAVTYSETGRFALWNGNCELGPTQLVRDGGAFGKIIADWWKPVCVDLPRRHRERCAAGISTHRRDQRGTGSLPRCFPRSVPRRGCRGNQG